MKDSKQEGKELNLGDFANGIEDIDDGVNVMDKEAIAQEEEWQNEFAEEGQRMTVADVVDDDSDKDILPGAKEAREEVEKKAKTIEEEKEKEEEEKELTDELFDDALTAKEKEDVADLNARFGTDFKDMKSFKEAFKKEDKTNEKEEAMEKKGKLISYLTNLKDSDDEALVYQDLRVTAHRKGQDVTDPEVDEAIKAEVEEFKLNNTLKFVAKTLRTSVDLELDKNTREFDAFNQSKVQTAEQKEADAKEDLKQATTKLYKGGKFYGLEVSQDQHMINYRQASNKTLIKELETNPELLVEMTLLYANREGIAKAMNSPSYSAGVKATFDAIKGQKSTQSAKTVIGQGQESDLPSFISDFIK